MHPALVGHLSGVLHLLCLTVMAADDDGVGGVGDVMASVADLLGPAVEGHGLQGYGVAVAAEERCEDELLLATDAQTVEAQAEGDIHRVALPLQTYGLHGDTAVGGTHRLSGSGSGRCRGQRRGEECYDERFVHELIDGGYGGGVLGVDVFLGVDGVDGG